MVMRKKSLSVARDAARNAARNADDKKDDIFSSEI
jgi:hypothetical protein